MKQKEMVINTLNREDTVQDFKNTEGPLISSPKSQQESTPACPCLPEKEFIDTLRENRTIFLNRPDVNALSKHFYPDNLYITSKYTVLTFLPKNLFEQFQKAANFYFLLIAIVISVPGVSTIEPYTSYFPLLFVLSVTAIREAYEDVQRHKSDAEINARLIGKVLSRSGELADITWKDILVGDIVKVEMGSEFPCDMVLLSSSDAEGSCNIMTANLDGETNLKTKLTLRATKDLRTPELLCKMRAKVEAEPPNADLHHFQARFVNRDTNESLPITPDNLLLRGAKLAETEWVFGLVIYTGFHTKLVLNSNAPRYKRSAVETEMNKQMMFIFLLQFIVVLISTIGSAVWQRDEAVKHWYLQDFSSLDRSTSIGVRNFFAFYILYSVFVPISLYVSMEIVKVVQSLYIWWDNEMYDGETQSYAMARNSNLNEELGQIRYVFSDKTGTLTQNKMSFYKCSVNGKKYGKDAAEPMAVDHSQFFEQEVSMSYRRRTLSLRMATKMSGLSKFIDPQFEADLRKKNEDDHTKVLREFCNCLSVCHTVDVVAEQKEGKLSSPSAARNAEGKEYRGVSVDEVALVIAASDFGYTLQSRDRDGIIVDSPFSKQNRWEILHVMDFTSDRKRMSVIAKTPDGKIVLYAKGADSEMLKRSSKYNNEKMMTDTKQHLEDFSLTGLRTLLLGYKYLDEEEYKGWAKRYKVASEAVDDRAAKMEVEADKIERDYIILGATAIEDALQVGVVDTLNKLRTAGIKVWMLTGDKQGTAVNIGKACGLIDNKYAVKYLTATTRETMTEQLLECQEFLDFSNAEAAANAAHGKAVTVSESRRSVEKKESKENLESAKNGVALVVDGPNLSHATMEENRDKFFNVINHPQTKVVICSRMAPKQKSEIVTIVKENIPGVITLAIGDGANDVSMIQAAHVGVGIRGKEGLNAVNNSDFAFGQFRFLARILLIHGHYSYKRNTKLILYSFYKSTVISFTQFFFVFVSAYSAQEVFDGILLNTFNLFFASLPILALSTLDMDLLPQELMANPEVYKSSINGEGFNRRVFWSYIATGIFHAIWVFFLPWYSFSDMSLWAQSMASYSCLVFVANFRIAIMMYTWTWINFVVTWGSILFWFLFGFGISGTSAVEYFPNLTGVFGNITSDGRFWLCMLWVSWIAMFQDIILKWFRVEIATPSLKLLIQMARGAPKQKHTGQK